MRPFWTRRVLPRSTLVGGTFAPTLLIGALGGATVSPACAHFAAAACLGAFFQAPVTAALILFELTKTKYALLVPTLLAAVAADKLRTPVQDLPIIAALLLFAIK